MMEKCEVLKTDVLIIGGGAAGVRAAIEADNQGADVYLLSKGPLARSGLTPLALPCFQAALGTMDPRDNPDCHYEDIIREGRQLADQHLAKVLAQEAVDRVVDLEKFGIRFEKQDEKYFQAHFPGQTYPRNLLIVGEGFGLISGLKKELRRHPKVKTLEDFLVFRLLTDNKEVAGAAGLNLRDGRFYAFHTKSVILACGGYEALWDNNDGAPDSTGDGVSLGFRAGADVIDLEMTQYYPGVLAYPESVKGVNIQYETFLEKKYFDFKLINNEGKEFLPEGPLPARDVLMRAIFTEIEEGRGTAHNAVYIDPTRSSKSQGEIEELVNRFFKGRDRYLTRLGINIRKDRMEICPSVHYTLGGLHINEKTETSVPGLFAAGENSSNTHGANRIGGNSLAETQVFGARAGKYASEWAKKKSHGLFPVKDVKEEIRQVNSFVEKKREGIRAPVLKKELRQLMDRYVGPNRKEEGMRKALEKILDLKQNGLTKVQVNRGKIFNTGWYEAVEASMALDLAELITRSALFREETRGHHFRSDFPGALEIPKHTFVTKRDNTTCVEYVSVIKVGE